MLPLTPANNYTQTIIFCGGSDMPDASWGDYNFPAINTWDYPASADCQLMTPEPVDGSQPQYVQDDDLPGGGRTMGQFILLPDGTALIVNGGLNGTAGYAQATGQTPTFGQMGFGESLASGPQLTPAIYDPTKPAGSRWSQSGLSAAKFPRLYHSSAILLPDASVLIAGSNPNVDVNTSTVFPTTYTAERFYPPYFSASTRPVPTGVPTNISYGGPYFNITVPSSSYTGSANDAAGNTTVMLMRPGFTTHAMNMGQRAVQLNNTYSVNNDGSYVLHVSQAPNNPNLLTPGPVFVFVVVKGIPSNGTYAIVGNGQIGTQPTADMAPLPAIVRLDNVSGSGNGNSSGSGSGSDTSSSSSHTGVIVGGIVAALAVLGIAGAVVGICLQRRRRANATSANQAAQSRYAGGTAGMRQFGGGAAGRGSEGDFVPLQHADAWNASTTSLNGPTTPYKDAAPGRGTPEYNPYESREQVHGGGRGGGF